MKMAMKRSASKKPMIAIVEKKTGKLFKMRPDRRGRAPRGTGPVVTKIGPDRVKVEHVAVGLGLITHIREGSPRGRKYQVFRVGERIRTPGARKRVPRRQWAK